MAAHPSPSGPVEPWSGGVGLGIVDEVTDPKWYWCLTHERAELAGERDAPENALGPYPSPEAAADWRRLNEERALKWKLQDEAWEGEPAED